jgi:histidine ammonia-lyase
MSARQLLFDGASLTIADLCAVADGDATVALSPEAAARLDASRAVVDRHARDERPMYGHPHRLRCAGGDQALDLLAPLATSPLLQCVHAHVRSQVPTLTDDRSPSPDIERIAAMIARGTLDASCGGEVK